MVFKNNIRFKASVSFKFKDPVVGQELKASIFRITNRNRTAFGNWTFPDKYLWDDCYYSQYRILNSDYLKIGE
jgi:hypothetical protein